MFQPENHPLPLQEEFYYPKSLLSFITTQARSDASMICAKYNLNTRIAKLQEQFDSQIPIDDLIFPLKKRNPNSSTEALWAMAKAMLSLNINDLNLKLNSLNDRHTNFRNSYTLSITDFIDKLAPAITSVNDTLNLVTIASCESLFLKKSHLFKLSFAIKHDQHEKAKLIKQEKFNERKEQLLQPKPVTVQEFDSLINQMKSLKLQISKMKSSKSPKSKATPSKKPKTSPVKPKSKNVQGSQTKKKVQKRKGPNQKRK